MIHVEINNSSSCAADYTIKSEDLVLAAAAFQKEDSVKKLHLLALNFLARKAFFESHPKAWKMMVSHKHNPVLEEKHVLDTDEAAPLGEYFLPFDALTLLIEKKIIKPALNPNSGYKVNHFIIIDNDKETLKNDLEHLPLENGENILIGHIEHVHAASAYVENNNGQIRCIIMELPSSQNDATDLAKTLHSVFPDASFAYLKTTIQKDFDNCSTLLIKSWMAFAKHGTALLDEMFNDPEATPALFLKMAQGLDRSKLTETALNTIVSKKKNLTLGQYLESQTVIFGSKKFSAAALRTKYKYLSELEELIV